MSAPGRSAVNAEALLLESSMPAKPAAISIRDARPIATSTAALEASRLGILIMPYTVLPAVVEL